MEIFWTLTWKCNMIPAVSDQEMITFPSWERKPAIFFLTPAEEKNTILCLGRVLLCFHKHYTWSLTFIHHNRGKFNIIGLPRLGYWELMPKSHAWWGIYKSNLQSSLEVPDTHISEESLYFVIYTDLKNISPCLKFKFWVLSKDTISLHPAA